ncbi:MAG TPA: hypothetical protein VGH13_09165 [Xanthobacteraceae bacterium]|jgi:hypothetical protein
MISQRYIGKYHVSTFVILSVYVGYYAYIIIRGHGVPYVMDNNETFSALLHARNLWSFDFFRSFGLADDATSPFAAAHPIVHTHQGDFPRLFAFVLYVFGARSAAAQIWITTFTIGIASVLLAQNFLRRIADDLFATIAVLLLITDYLLVAQWQVDIYRVWHSFFLFGSLVCAHGLKDWKRSYWLAATILLYAGLLYWELIFAAFVAVSSGAYTIWLYRRSPRLFLYAGCIESVGAILGLGLVLIQASLYLGWAGFLTDLQLTYGARNFTTDVANSLLSLKKFYDIHNVTFWFNVQETAKFSIVAFLRSISLFFLQVQTPIFSFMSLSLAAAAIFADSRLPRPGDTKIALRSISMAATLVMVPGLISFLINLTFEDVATSRSLFGIDFYALAFYTIAFVGILMAVALRHVSTLISMNRTPPGLYRCSVAGAYFLLLGIFIAFSGLLYDRASENLWLSLLPLPLWMTKLLMCGAALAGGLLVLCGRRSLLGFWHRVPTAALPFFVSGLIGYLFVYVTSPGYVYSGYLDRLCPLLVFHLDTMLALGLFVPVAAALGSWGRNRKYLEGFSMAAVPGIFGLLAVTLVCCWIRIQDRYFDLIPPDLFGFTKQLSAIAVPTTGIVSNTYAAPFGYIANTWAYQSDVPPGGDLASLGTGQTNNEYLWFADRNTNLSYRRPGLFVCFESLGIYPFRIDPDDPELYTRRQHCAKMLVINSHRNGDPDIALIARDKKFDLWAIYGLKWK